MATTTIETPASAATKGPLSSFSPKPRPEQILLGTLDLGPQRNRTPEAVESGLARELTPPSEAVDAKLRWNTPRTNTWRLGLTFLALFNLGLNDASFGVRL